MARRRIKKVGGGQGIGERFVPLVHSVLTSPAWANLSPLARALFVQLRARISVGCPAENNGRVFLSVRDAAAELNVHRDTVSRAFDELQRHGFIVVTQLGHLGAEGYGKATLYRLTDCGCRQHPRGSREFLQWRPGADFPVKKAPAPRRRKSGEVISAA